MIRDDEQYLQEYVHPLLVIMCAWPFFDVSYSLNGTRCLAGNGMLSRSCMSGLGSLTFILD